MYVLHPSYCMQGSIHRSGARCHPALSARRPVLDGLPHPSPPCCAAHIRPPVTFNFWCAILVGRQIGNGTEPETGHSPRRKDQDGACPFESLFWLLSSSPPFPLKVWASYSNQGQDGRTKKDAEATGHADTSRSHHTASLSQK